MLSKLIFFLKRLHRISNNFDCLLNTTHRSNMLLNSSLTNEQALVVEINNNEKELIVSFTTYNKRIHDVHLVIESIAQQTVKPNRLILWLDEEEFTLETIPLILHRQIKRGLEVRFCPNYKSYKKLIPTLNLFPAANIITIDDDVLYPHDMIEILMSENKKYPKYIIGHRGHKIKFTPDKRILPYLHWDYDIRAGMAGYDIFLTGVGGVLYPPNSLSNIVLSSEVFMDLCLNADDVWFKAMSLLNDVQCKIVNDERDFFTRFLLIPNSQDIALQKTNLFDNDLQIKAVFNHYNLENKFFDNK